MRLGENGVGRNALQPGAGLRDHRGEPLQIQRHEAAVGRLHMQRRRGGGRRPLPRNLGLGALARALRAIEHIGARDLVMLAAHQRKFGLILNVLDVKGAPGIGAARQSGDDLIGEFGDDVMHAPRGRGGVALDGQERFRQRQRNLGGIERRNRPVASNDLIARLVRGRRRRDRRRQTHDTRRRCSFRSERHWPKTPWYVAGRGHGGGACRSFNGKCRKPAKRPTGTPRPGTI